MLHLIDYVKSKSIQEFYLDSEKYKLLEIYFDNEIPADIEEKFANDSSKDYILEFLITQNFVDLENAKQTNISNKLHYGKYVYHVTSKENADKILKTGLRPRKNISNREYDPRVYFIASNTDIRDKLKSIIDSVYDGDESKCVILKIELPIRNINVYKDETRANNDYSFYTYSPIPANYITKNKLKSIK